MILLFHKVRTGGKGQLASFLTVILIIFLMLAFLTVNLGKISLVRTRSSNTSDAAALAAGSIASVLLNYITCFNETMMANFIGLNTQLMSMFLTWLWNAIKFLIVLVKAIADVIKGGGESSEKEARDIIDVINDIINYKSGKDVGIGKFKIVEKGESLTSTFWSLAMDTIGISLLVSGAKKLGEGVEKLIRETNEKLPKNTRDTSRLYAFMNAGIDEPKISYEAWREEKGKSDNDDSWKEYLNSETGFAKFIRELSETNKSDTNYGLSTLSFSWQDRRVDKTVNNSIDVKVQPFPKLNLRTVTFGEVVRDEDLKNKIKGLIEKRKNDPDPDRRIGSVAAWLMDGAINVSSFNLSFVEVVFGFWKLIMGIITVIAAVAVVVAIVLWIVCAFTGNYCDTAWRLTKLAAVLGLIAYAGHLVEKNFMNFSPQDVPALVIEGAQNTYTLDVEISRTTQSATIDYGLWSTKYPVISSFSKAELVDGKIFPPEPIFDAVLVEVK